MTSKIDFYETSDLAEPRKIALRITDAVHPPAGCAVTMTLSTGPRPVRARSNSPSCAWTSRNGAPRRSMSLWAPDGTDGLPVNEEGVVFPASGLTEASPASGPTRTPVVVRTRTKRSAGSCGRAGRTPVIRDTTSGDFAPAAGSVRVGPSGRRP